MSKCRMFRAGTLAIDNSGSVAIISDLRHSSENCRILFDWLTPMKTTKRVTFALVALIASSFSYPSNNTTADELSVGMGQRTPWTTSRIAGSPDPPLPYVTERAFPSLKFDQCLDIAKVPGGDRFFIVERAGKIFSFRDEAGVAKADLAVDVAKEIEGVRNVYAITFHPDFQQNRYCYLCYIKEANLEDGTHVARFEVTDTDPPTIDISTETTLITWFSGGHNGCCLKFGHDGFLYISTGDGAPANPPDTMRAGQDVTNLLSAILRIDVDQGSDGRNYRIPADNPFVDSPGARGEIWAYGFRNPWRMSFDRVTGDLWVGDVGWELWEMLDRVQRGGNYGWGVMEGRQLTQPEWPRGPTPFLPPTIDHPHSESSSITDGLTYYGSRLKELYSAHIYGDYDTGKFWSFRWQNGQVVDHREIADTTLRVVAFGEDGDGEFYILDHPAGTIHRLIPNPSRNRSSDFPHKLSDTGLFNSVVEQTPAAGVVPYSINAEPWADHAVAQRFVAVPNELSIDAAAATYSFPQDSVLVKTISLDLEQGNPATRRKVETQVLHFDGIDWQPYTYQWNGEQSDAVLLTAAGAEQTFDVVDADAPGGIRRQTWRFASRTECQRCHNKWSGPPLAFNTPQLNRTHDYDGRLAPQLETLTHVKLIEKLAAAEDRLRLEDPMDSSADLDARARAYLHVNCAHCHRLHAGSAVLSHMHYDLALEKTNMVGTRPSQGTFGIHAAHVIAPGDPFRSVLLYRMSKLGGGRMPRLGSTEIDIAGIELLHEWIGQISGALAADTTGDEVAVKLRSDEAADLALLRQARLPDQAEVVQRLMSSTSGAFRLLRSIERERLTAEQVGLSVATGTGHQDVRIRDLFERFLAPDKRVKRLGSAVHPEQILSLAGDAARGKQVFFATAGVQCKNCHRINKEGKEVGPDLSAIGKKLDRGQLLESILEPSKRVDPKYVTYLAETDQGRLLTGLLVEKNDQHVILKDAQSNEVRIPAEGIEQLVPQGRSLMPELLLRDMTAQQVADLLEYLGSLKP